MSEEQTAQTRQQGAILTGVCHGEAVPHLNHIHLRHQFGDVLVVREGEAKNLIFVRFGREQAPCGAARGGEDEDEETDILK